MKMMPNIDLPRERLDYIMTMERFGKGGEAIVCYGERPDTLYKIFVNPVSGEIIMPDNKFRKVVGIHQMQLKHSVKPLSTISVDGISVGYEMSYNPNNVPIAYASLDRQQRIKMLKRTKTALEYFCANGIIYADIKNDNILINPRTGEIEFCDMDNVQQGANPIDIMGKELSWYIKQRGSVDETASAWMHNLFTLTELGFPTSYTTYEGVLITLGNREYPTKFKERARPIFESMTSPEKFNGEYAIQHIKR